MGCWQPAGHRTETHMAPALTQLHRPCSRQTRRWPALSRKGRLGPGPRDTPPQQQSPHLIPSRVGSRNRSAPQDVHYMLMHTHTSTRRTPRHHHTRISHCLRHVCTQTQMHSTQLPTEPRHRDAHICASVLGTLHTHINTSTESHWPPLTVDSPLTHAHTLPAKHAHGHRGPYIDSNANTYMAQACHTHGSTPNTAPCTHMTSLHTRTVLSGQLTAAPLSSPHPPGTHTHSLANNSAGPCSDRPSTPCPRARPVTRRPLLLPGAVGFPIPRTAQAQSPEAQWP